MALDMQTQMRLTGMASGLDTDAVIANLGKVHTLRINKVKQDKQLAVWRQEQYRETISKLTNFIKSNLNVSNPSSNFRSSAAFAKFSYSVKGKSSAGIDASELLSVTANGDLRNFSQTVQKVTQLATKDTYTGRPTDLQGITTKGLNYYNFGIFDKADGSGGTWDPNNIKYANIGISIDGTSRTISITPAELLAAYDAETGGAYKVIAAGSDKEAAADKVVNALVNGVGNTNHVFMRKDDGSIGEIDEDAIYKWYNDVNKVKFATPGSPTPTEKEAAIRAYFADNAVYSENLNYVPTVGIETETYVNEIVNDLVKGSGSNISSVLFINAAGDKINADDIYAWYEGVNGPYDDPSNPDDDEKEEALRAYFGANGLYKAVQVETPKSSTALANLINSKIEKLYGADFANIVTATPSGELKFQKQGSTITIFDQTGFDAVSKGMGLVGGATSAGAVNSTKIVDLVGQDYFDYLTGVDGVPLTINGVTVMVTEEDTIGSFMTKLNGSEAGVTLAFTASTNTFTLTSKLEGTANNITMANPATQIFFDSAFGFDDDSRTKAQNFIGTINGEEYIRQSNTFTHEGMTFTFNKVFDATDDPIKIEVSKNTSEIVTGIKAFVEEYNALVTHINDLLSGKRDRSYPPLTEDERKAMKDEEIKLYEDKAKLGLMANDSQLRKLLSDMRMSLYQKVEGVGLTMTDIGISTSANYTDGGTLVIDEEKLKSALEKNYDGVVSLFTKSSSVPSSDKANSAKRASESGIAQRLNDILTAAAGTSTGGEKGYLLQKAGMVNDRTQYDNTLTKQINDYDKKIDQLLERWYRQENAYYAMFARMETAMSKLQAQQNSLAQIMAQSGG